MPAGGTIYNIRRKGRDVSCERGLSLGGDSHDYIEKRSKAVDSKLGESTQRIHTANPFDGFIWVYILANHPDDFENSISRSYYVG